MFKKLFFFIVIISIAMLVYFFAGLRSLFGHVIDTSSSAYRLLVQGNQSVVSGGLGDAVSLYEQWKNLTSDLDVLTTLSTNLRQAKSLVLSQEVHTCLSTGLSGALLLPRLISQQTQIIQLLADEQSRVAILLQDISDAPHIDCLLQYKTSLEHEYTRTQELGRRLTSRSSLYKGNILHYIQTLWPCSQIISLSQQLTQVFLLNQQVIDRHQWWDVKNLTQCQTTLSQHTSSDRKMSAIVKLWDRATASPTYESFSGSWSDVVHTIKSQSSTRSTLWLTSTGVSLTDRIQSRRTQLSN